MLTEPAARSRVEVLRLLDMKTLELGVTRIGVTSCSFSELVIMETALPVSHSNTRNTISEVSAQHATAAAECTVLFRTIPEPASATSNFLSWGASVAANRGLLFTRHREVHEHGIALEMQS